jgi:hypothetical protein
MKKPTTRSLALNPETLRRLSDEQILAAAGGQRDPRPPISDGCGSRSRPVGC